MKDIDFDKEEVKEIYLFKTSLIGNQIKLVKPTLNIQKKNIEGLIDYEDFKKNNLNHYFTNLENFSNIIKKI